MAISDFSPEAVPRAASAPEPKADYL